jgi:phosphoglycolate phosphatase-like HAD superfamily hydrolase
MGREITAEEWITVDRVFHDAYREVLEEARLTVDAAEALTTVASGGHTQSLLSMFPQQDLIPLVERIGITGFFDRIDGLAEGSPGDLKAVYLERHLRQLIAGEDPRSVVVIGDTPDDAIAAIHVGARPILYDGGSHHRHDLEATGAEVASTLVAAVGLALQ